MWSFQILTSYPTPSSMAQRFGFQNQGLDPVGFTYSISNCKWDQGINFDGLTPFVEMEISDCEIGASYSSDPALFSDCQAAKKLTITTSYLRHKKGMVRFHGSYNHVPGATKIALGKVAFISQAAAVRPCQRYWSLHVLQQSCRPQIQWSFW